MNANRDHGVRSISEVAFECALSATRGRRPYQEDSAIFWPGSATFTHDLHLPSNDPASLVAILADGMGGHAGGAIASKIACQTCLEGLAGLLDLAPFQAEAAETHHRSDAAAEEDHPDNGNSGETTLTRPPRPATDNLTAALCAANAEIAAQAAQDAKLTGMGTTLVATTFTPRTLEWVSVGDSPLYLYRDGEIALLNEDHSLAPALDQLARDGHITPEAAHADPRRHMLRSALSGEPLDLVDRCRKPLTLCPGDIIILASDGLQTLDTSEIARIITAKNKAAPVEIATSLINAVEQRREPYQDNATVMVIRKPA
jgi:protein phosphatase